MSSRVPKRDVTMSQYRATRWLLSFHPEDYLYVIVLMVHFKHLMLSKSAKKPSVSIFLTIVA